MEYQVKQPQSSSKVEDFNLTGQNMGLLEDRESLLQLLKLPPTASATDIKAKVDSGQSRFLEIGKQVRARRDDIDRKIKGIDAQFNTVDDAVAKYLKNQTWTNLQPVVPHLKFSSPHGVTWFDVLTRWNIFNRQYQERRKELVEEKEKADAEKERYKKLTERVVTVNKAYLDFFHQLQIQSGMDGKLKEVTRQLGVDDLKKFDELLEKLKEEKDKLKEETEEKEEPRNSPREVALSSIP